MRKVLGIVYRAIATHQVQKTVYAFRTARTGPVILVSAIRAKSSH